MIAFGEENPEIKYAGGPFLIKTIEYSLRFIIALPIEGPKEADMDDSETQR